MPPENIYGKPAVDNVVFNFNDIVTGRTALLFYAFESTNSVGEDHHLSQTAIKSTDPTSESNTTVDRDFDILVNKPITIEGDVIFTIKFGQSGGGGGGGAIATNANLIRVDKGAGENTLGNVTSSDFTPGGDGNTTITMVLNVSKTTFSIGEKIRLTVTVTGGSGATQQATLWHDPVTAGNELKMWLPSKTQN